MKLTKQAVTDTFGVMTITAKGQVTIPQALRNRYSLRPGTQVEFLPMEDGLHLVTQKAQRHSKPIVDAWLAKATGSATTALTTDALMKMTRGED
ncbi:AbrB/MazE/SpoVT family DNA-binding domain-containing protein [Prosthecobacter fusiformis]|nr:AbrB/MazE/SpoVT family DNA-binding domain-containing protein [Prosthecobacter fusiformis]